MSEKRNRATAPLSEADWNRKFNGLTLRQIVGRLAFVESGGVAGRDQDNRGPARGITQFEPALAAELGMDEVFLRDSKNTTMLLNATARQLLERTQQFQDGLAHQTDRKAKSLPKMDEASAMRNAILSWNIGRQGVYNFLTGAPSKMTEDAHRRDYTKMIYGQDAHGESAPFEATSSENRAAHARRLGDMMQEGYTYSSNISSYTQMLERKQADTDAKMRANPSTWTVTSR